MRNGRILFRTAASASCHASGGKDQRRRDLDRHQQSRNVQARRPNREAHGLRRDATRRARRVRTAEGPRGRDSRLAGGRGRRGQSYRHQRLLRSARHQRNHPRGAAPLSRRSRYRHQNRREARHGRVLAPGHGAGRTRKRRPRQSAQSPAGRHAGREPQDHGRGPRSGRGLDRGAAHSPRRPPAAGPGAPHRAEQRHRCSDRGRARGSATSSAFRTTTMSHTATTTR